MTDSYDISCEACQDRLDEFALDVLPVDVCAQVSAHLDGGCPDCNRRLAELLADLAQLPQSLPLAAPPPSVERELMRRITAERSQAPNAPPADATKSRRWLLAAASLAVAASLVGVALWLGRPAPAPSTIGPAPGDWAELERRILDAQESQQINSTPQLHFVSRGPAAPAADVYGYVVQDRLTQQFHIYVFNLPQLADDRAYQFWFVTNDGQYLPENSVRPAADGSISLLVEQPSSATEVVAVAISNEPAEGSQSPSRDSLLEATL